MEKIQFIAKDDSRLRQKAEKITDFENKEEYQKIIDYIVDLCIENGGYATAAPQLGILKQLVVIISVKEFKKGEVKSREDYTISAYFNPSITKMEGEQQYCEACISVGDYIGKVKRPYQIELEYQDIEGVKKHRHVEGFEAIILCHEIDHLDGILFTDKVVGPLYEANLEERIEIRKQNPHEIISKTGMFCDV